MKTFGILGFGNFGRFMAKHLAGRFDVVVSNQPGTDISEAATALGVRTDTLEAAAGCDIVVLCVPVQHLEELLKTAAPHVRPDALVLDVASVKVKPVRLMREYLPESAEIIATHPLFGPMSGKNGIAGLPFVYCPVRTTRTEKVRTFLAETLGVNVIESTPEEHDTQMAYVQGLTHFIGRALNRMEIPELVQKTALYDHLHAIVQTVNSDTYDLFLTIQRENPLAEGVRQKFIEALVEIHREIGPGT